MSGVPGGRESVDEACGWRAASLVGRETRRRRSRTGTAGVGLPYRLVGYAAGAVSSWDVGVGVAEARPLVVF